MEIKIYLANYITFQLLWDCFNKFTITEYDSFENSIKINTARINRKVLEINNMIQGKDYEIIGE